MAYKISKKIFLSSILILPFLLSSSCAIKPIKFNKIIKNKIENFKVIPNKNNDFGIYGFNNLAHLSFGTWKTIEGKYIDVNLKLELHKKLLEGVSTSFGDEIFKNMLLNRKDYMLDDFTNEEYKKLFDNYTYLNKDILSDSSDAPFDRKSAYDFYDYLFHPTFLNFSNLNNFYIAKYFDDYQKFINPFWESTNPKVKEYNVKWQSLLKKYDEKFFEENYLIIFRGAKSFIYTKKNNDKVISYLIRPKKIRSISLDNNHHLSINYQWDFINVSGQDLNKIDNNIEPYEIIFPKTKWNERLIDQSTYVRVSSAYTDNTNLKFVYYAEKLFDTKLFKEVIPGMF
ncbi:hypothetical protein [Metamycoplasma hyosynoviae]|uniref:hypothetical protein n=1 Tax=Metamycoplasma hyosynoviae TaxID=29559 RepID=UPI0023594B83|nr:hypothetical protein [Metamycoplasma hyosynoviae]MDC8937853.1 hypothetical protein [Metamycoplasma hyosynoviae]